MIYSEINLSNSIIQDLIFNNSERCFESKVKLIKDDGLTNLVFQSSKLRLLGIDPEKKIIEVEFLDEYPKFYKFILNVDGTILRNIFNNSKDLFGEKSSYETLQNLFQRSIILPKNLKYNPTMILNISKNCKIIDRSGEVVDISDLKENNEIVCNIKVKQVKFRESEFRIDYRINCIKIENYVCCVTEYLFSDEEEDYLNSSKEMDIISTDKNQ